MIGMLYVAGIADALGEEASELPEKFVAVTVNV